MITRYKELEDFIRNKHHPKEACQEWWGCFSGGAPGKKEYGFVGDKARPRKSRMRTANNVALEIVLGRPLKPQHGALHTCDNTKCVNPNHLYEGTPRQNSADMVARGRQSRGTQHGVLSQAGKNRAKASNKSKRPTS